MLQGIFTVPMQHFAEENNGTYSTVPIVQTSGSLLKRCATIKEGSKYFATFEIQNRKQCRL